MQRLEVMLEHFLGIENKRMNIFVVVVFLSSIIQFIVLKIWRYGESLFNLVIMSTTKKKEEDFLKKEGILRLLGNTLVKLS